MMELYKEMYLVLFSWTFFAHLFCKSTIEFMGPHDSMVDLYISYMEMDKRYTR